MEHSEPFINPYDGYRAELHAVPSHEVYCIMVYYRSEGERQREITIRSFVMNEAGYGQATLCLALVSAMCRYLSAGGDALSNLTANLKLFASEDKIDFPDPWYLMQAVMDPEEPTIFVTNSKTGECLVVKEDTYVESVDVGDIPSMVSDECAVPFNSTPQGDGAKEGDGDQPGPASLSEGKA